MYRVLVRPTVLTYRSATRRMVLEREVTTRVAAEYLGVTIIRVLQLIAEGKLIADKKGTRDYWVTAESLKAYKGSRRVGRPAGTLSKEPAQSARFGTGERAEREREYQREYRRKLRAAEKKGASSSSKTAAKKRSGTK